MTIISTMVIWESSQRLKDNLVLSTGKKISEKAWVGGLADALKVAISAIQYSRYYSFVLPDIGTRWQNFYAESVECYGRGYLGSILNPFPNKPWFLRAIEVFWKHCGKRINCSLRAISPFPTVFSTRLENLLTFSSSLKLSSANTLSLKESKICRLGKV